MRSPPSRRTAVADTVSVTREDEIARIDVLMRDPNYRMAVRLRGEAFILEDAASGHRKRVDVRTMQPVGMTREQEIMVRTYERTSKLMREAADLIDTLASTQPAPAFPREEVERTIRLCEERARSYGGLRPIAPTAIALDRAAQLLALLQGKQP
jgi:hypothetical protein